MKPLIAFLYTLFLTFNVDVQASSLLRHKTMLTNHTDSTPTRALANDGRYGFVMSHIRKNNPWCLTVTHGSEDFARLGFRRCQFDDAPARQLWKLDANGQLHTRVDHTKCMTLNHGKDLFNGVLARLADCQMDTNLNTFVLERHGKTGSYFKVVNSPEYCITNTGRNPNAHDAIHAKPCVKRHDYKWTYVMDGSDLVT